MINVRALVDLSCCFTGGRYFQGVEVTVSSDSDLSSVSAGGQASPSQPLSEWIDKPVLPPELIPDPSAVRPETWDEEEDGVNIIVHDKKLERREPT